MVKIKKFDYVDDDGIMIYKVQIYHNYSQRMAMWQFKEYCRECSNYVDSFKCGFEEGDTFVLCVLFNNLESRTNCINNLDEFLIKYPEK